jgi:hypothetical protein
VKGDVMCAVVAITVPGDAHLSFVQAHLEDDMIVIDPQAMQRNEELSYYATAHGAHVIFRGEALDRVTGVWYRKPGELSIEALPVPDHFGEYALGALRNHFSMLRRAFQSAAWVSDYFAIERMRNKFYQLQLARECGFLVPDTLITSSRERAQAFIAANAPCIVKPQATVHPAVNGTSTFFYATMIDNYAAVSLEGLHLAPAIFQCAVDTQYDVRVNVVGRQAFGAVIRNEGVITSAVRDWRIGHSEGVMLIDEYDLPPDITAKCIAYTQRSHLLFSAFDFAVDKDDRFWFLEDNPNGQWAFIEQWTRQPIGRSIAALLTGRSQE